MVYDKQKTALVDDPSDLINISIIPSTCGLGKPRRPSTRVIRSLGFLMCYATDGFPLVTKIPRPVFLQFILVSYQQGGVVVLGDA
jgi:hypothetical protein